MKVTLNNYTPLVVCSNAIRECWQSQDKSDNGGPIDLALIDRVGNQFKHSSTLEHLIMTWTFSNVTATSEVLLISKFESSSFSTCTGDTSEFVVTTNVRELQSLRLDNAVLHKLLPESYKYLFGLSEH